MIGRKMGPKHVHALRPGTCECVALYGRRDSADMIKLMAMRWENYPDRPNVITGSFKSGRDK